MAERELIVTETPASPPPSAPEAEPTETDDAAAPEETEGEADAAEETDKAEKKPRRSYEDVERELKSQRARAAKERSLRQQEAERNRQLADTVRRIEEWRAEQAKPKPAAQEIPDEEADPIGALKHLKNRLAQFDRERQEQEARDQRMRAMAQQVDGVRNTVSQIETEYAEENPDYFQAADHVTNLWRRQHEAAGYSPDDAQVAVFRQALSFTQAALHSGRNPAEAMYAIAHEMGYRKPQEKTPSPLERVKAGQAVAKTMSGGGRSPRGPISFEDISKIKNPDAFSKALKEYETRMIKGG